MVHIVRPIDIISHSDGKHYTSLRAYEKSLDAKGQYIMEDRHYRQLSEKLQDEAHSAPRSKAPEYNHVHIDFNNGSVEKSLRNLDE